MRQTAKLKLPDKIPLHQLTEGQRALPFAFLKIIDLQSDY